MFSIIETRNNLFYKKSRTIELVLGILGGVFGLIGAACALFIGEWGTAIGAAGALEPVILGLNAFLEYSVLSYRFFQYL